MKLRPPSVPLVTVDPYFALWSPSDKLTDVDTTHWTGRANLLRGVAVVDGKPYRFLGRGPEPALEQKSLSVDFFSTRAVFEGAGIRLSATFTTPLLPDDFAVMSRPVSFAEIAVEPLGRARPEVSVRFSASEQFCLDKEGDSPVETRKERYGAGLVGMSVGSAAPRVLERWGDNIRIEWGRFHLAVAATGVKTRTFREKDVRFLVRSLEEHERSNYRPGYPKMQLEDAADLSFVSVEAPVQCGGGGAEPVLFLLAYDDCGASVEYFGKRCGSYWNKDGKTAEQAVAVPPEDGRACQDAALRVPVDADGRPATLASDTPRNLAAVDVEVRHLDVRQLQPSAAYDVADSAYRTVYDALRRLDRRGDRVLDAVPDVRGRRLDAIEHARNRRADGVHDAR
ncbi:MAG: DUF4964 domain-containing protein, partial [Kiritimatiellae bacterium]|nr:DUF4964 domain-containing protein [Kiritimatiellia bacterium]